MLRPCKQWICDTCGEVIGKPEDGWLEWLQDLDTLKTHGFRIVHHCSKSPRRAEGENCYQYGKRNDLRHDQSMHLDDVTGPSGMVFLMSLLDVGRIHDPEAKFSRVKDVREWAELVRRLTFPYYEEARNYFDHPGVSAFLGGANEIYTYQPDNLKRMIEHCENEAATHG